MKEKPEVGHYQWRLKMDRFGQYVLLFVDMRSLGRDGMGGEKV